MAALLTQCIKVRGASSVIFLWMSAGHARVGVVAAMIAPANLAAALRQGNSPMSASRIAWTGLAVSLVAACARPAASQVYHQNFEINSTATWTVNGGPSDEMANFFFDYSTVGIPPAPSAIGTRGMKLQANLFSGIFGGFSVSPTNLFATGDFVMRFDWWANFNGPFPLGGSGSANLSTFGVGTAGTVAQWPGAGAQLDSVMFGAVGDGNSSSDWRAYSTAAITSYPSGSPIYAAAGAGNTNNTHPHYAIFGGVAAPAAQLALFPQQSGITHIGAAGMQWHHVRIRKGDGLITWTVDGLRIATIDLNTVTLGGSRVFFGHSDTNATSSTDPNDAALLFTLIDNIRVARLADVDGDGVVNIDDLLAVIAAWGPCPAPPVTCAADVTDDGAVDIDDLLRVIGGWG
jgi:hypothetical protein